MGMYDTIITPDVCCVMCGRSLKDMQTKSGDCMLTSYEIGDKFPLPKNVKYIEAYTSCVHEWDYPSGKAKEFADTVGFTAWQAVHGIWIDASIPLDKYGRIEEPEYWTLEYRKMRMSHNTIFYNKYPGVKMENPRTYTAKIGDAIRKYYGTVDDELWWKDVTDDTPKH